MSTSPCHELDLNQHIMEQKTSSTNNHSFGSRLSNPVPLSWVHPGPAASRYLLVDQLTLVLMQPIQFQELVMQSPNCDQTELYSCMLAPVVNNMLSHLCFSSLMMELRRRGEG